MKCLFDPCEADIKPEARRSMPLWGRGGGTEHYVVPLHDVVGEASWFGRCPASQIELQVHGTISDAARDVLLDGTKHYRSMMRDRIRRATEAYDAAAAGGDPTKTHPDRMPQGRPVTGTTAAYFPPRTGDEGERQNGDPKPQQPPAGVAGLPAGDIIMEDARHQLLALTSIAKQGFANSGSASNSLWGAVDGLSEGINAIVTQLESVQTVARAAVGGAGEIPEDAANMIHAASAALAELADANAALVVASNHARAVVSACSLGEQAAERYMGRL